MAPHWLRSSAVAATLRAGQSFVRHGVTLCGDLDLAGADIKGLFECRGCTLSGRLLAPEAIFESTVDLSGIRVTKTVDMQGVRFERPALFDVGPDRSPATFAGRVDLSLATFRGVAAFRQATFNGFADFDFARFGGDAIFDLASFARASFASSHFDGRASFAGEGTVFGSTARFASASFSQQAVFTQAEFDGDARFDGSTFANDGSFIGADFTSVSFDDVRAAKSLDLTGVSANSASFTNTVAHSVSLRDTTFSRSGIVIYHVVIGDLELAVGDVSYVRGEPRNTLRLIEQSAKNRGDLGVANDAYYEERVLASNGYGPELHALDVVFYRWIAGYLVRPWHPLLALLVLMVVFAAIRGISRVLASTTRSASFSRRARRLTLGGVSLLDTAGAVVGGRTDDGTDDGVRAFRRVERLIYRVLLVCIVIGLANSNPSLRQILDALR
jgi:uncharacterized protein YjbI with pentapeptide repeats